MGNTDSQYSSFVVPGKPCSLTFHSRREEVQSAHTWWRGNEVAASGYKTRGTGRCHLPQHKSSQPYGSSRHYEHVAKAAKGVPGNKLRASSPQKCGRGDRAQGSCKNGHRYGYLESSGESNCFSLGGQQSPERTSLSEPAESRGSPKVLLSKDGSMRVEFTNTRIIPVETQGIPALPAAAPEASLRTSKGSSLSSEGSWYDSPWGNATELSDNVFTCGQNVDNSSGYTTYSSTRTEETGCGYTSSGYNTFSSAQTEDMSPGFSASLLFPIVDNGGSEFPNPGYGSLGYNTCSSGRTEDSGIGDSVILQPDSAGFGSPPASLTDLRSSPGVAAPFPTAQFQDGAQHRASLSSVLLDSVIQEESPDDQRYSCHTLPCRKAEQQVPATGNSRKDSLKSRIRRLSDWTGSLSRKKRRIQEPYGSETSEGFNNGLDPGPADPSCLWSSNPLHAQPQHPAPVQSVRYGSSRSLQGQQHQNHGDALRQNIYENFMQELETGCSGPERAVPSEGEGEDGRETDGELGESSSGSLGSLEQLDLLFEKEQGVVRRAGWLSFKALLTLHKDKKLELVARRKWRQYWVTLKGCTLLFYETYGKGGPEQELSPRYALLADDSIVQAIPEHPKKENVFCLSNSYGDVYLFQAANQTDLENWVTAIHSASASLLAKRQGKEDTVRLLRGQTRALLQKIDMDGKMKKMAELQLSVISDQKNRKAIESQIQQWDQNLEKFNMDLFRMRCYLASLQGSELPNPKSLLAVASRPSKTTLGRLGLFSVSSFHALICSRDESTLRRRCRSLSRGARNKRGLFSSLKGLDSLTKRSKEQRHSASQIFESQAIGPPGHILTGCSSERLDAPAKAQSVAPSEDLPWYSTLESQVCVTMPDSQVVMVPVKVDSLVSDVLSLACKERQLDLDRYCLHVRRHVGQNIEISAPALTDPIRELVYDELEVFRLNVFTVQLSRHDAAVDFGFAVTGHVDGAGKSHVYVSEVGPQGLAFTEGLKEGDEILVLNGTHVSGLDLGLMHSFFSHQTLQLLIRREDLAPEDHSPVWPDCETIGPCQPPPPGLLPAWPTDVPLSGETPDCPPPPVFDDMLPASSRPADDTEQRGQNVETVYTLYRTFPEGGCNAEVEGQRNPYSKEASPQRPCPRHMSVSQRLCKVIQELVDTEKSYVKDLGCLFDIYLTPLQNETFLSKDEMESLFGSLPEMLDFQRVFLHTLEERVASCPNFNSLETPEQFKKLLFSLGGSFLYYADHFKLYSGFCANHIKVQKVLERAKTDRAFKEFLEARNPTKQHSSTLESYLIKPVQRVLKYPLLLRELVSLTDSESEEHSHLTEALRAMEKVASHINEMQKIYEDYGTVFDQLVAEQSGPEKEVTEISMGEFLIHSPVVWLNPLPSLGRMRKDPELTLFVFKRAVILVYRESGKLKKKMGTLRSADLDPFKFRWLIPVSAVQVRLGNTAGTEDPYMWELIHTKSQVEGRPETVFQLCSSGLENKASVVKALRSLLRDGTRRAVPASLLRDATRKAVPAERAFREHHTGSLRRAKPSAERSASWRRRQQRQAEAERTGHQEDEGSASSSAFYPGDTCSEPQLPSRATDLPSLEGTALGKRARLCSLTSALEAQLQRLNFTEDLAQSVGHGCPRSAQTGVGVEEGPAGGEDAQSVDLDSLLERDYSVQSMASVISEDCFYDTVMGIQKAAIPTL